jgi:hypothetical protein
MSAQAAGQPALLPAQSVHLKGAVPELAAREVRPTTGLLELAQGSATSKNVVGDQVAVVGQDVPDMGVNVSAGLIHFSRPQCPRKFTGACR